MTQEGVGVKVNRIAPRFGFPNLFCLSGIVHIGWDTQLDRRGTDARWVDH
jgi:hypothetical protein